MRKRKLKRLIKERNEENDSLRIHLRGEKARVAELSTELERAKMEPCQLDLELSFVAVSDSLVQARYALGEFANACRDVG